MKIGEIMAADREITLNEGKKKATDRFRSVLIFTSLK